MKNTLMGSPAFVPRIASGDGIYDTATLMEILYAPQNAPELAGFWLKFFGRTVNFDTEKIMFDALDTNEYRLAPFVAPNVQGRIIRSKGFDTRSFRPAYTKPKHVIDPSRAIPRRAGETPFLGSLSRAQRYDLILADNLRTERLMIENRWDWMACQAIVTGAVVVAGDDYPTVTVDFGRDASLTVALTGSATWDSDDATPMANLQSIRSAAFKLSRAPVSTLIFGEDAWNAFVLPSHTDVQTLMNVLRKGNDSLFNVQNISDGSPFEYQGNIAGPGGAGRLDLYKYNNWYEGDNGVGVPYFDTSTVVGVGGAVQGVQCFGAIADKRAGLLPVPMFPKVWDVEDPSATFTLTQSAPLPVPMRPNNTFSIKVLA